MALKRYFYEAILNEINLKEYSNYFKLYSIYLMTMYFLFVQK